MMDFYQKIYKREIKMKIKDRGRDIIRMRGGNEGFIGKGMK